MKNIYIKKLSENFQFLEVTFSIYMYLNNATGDQVTGLTPTGSATLFHRDLIMKYFLWPFSPFH